MDIVSRLLAIKNPYGPGPHTDCREAAAEITRLRKERDEARAAISTIAKHVEGMEARILPNAAPPTPEATK
jgi:hypothetical protein